MCGSRQRAAEAHGFGVADVLGAVERREHPRFGNTSRERNFGGRIQVR
jgi:hypothetical protein